MKEDLGLHGARRRMMLSPCVTLKNHNSQSRKRKPIYILTQNFGLMLIAAFKPTILDVFVINFAFVWALTATLTTFGHSQLRGHPFMTSTRRGMGLGTQAQVDACGRGEGGPAPCGRPHRKLKLESTHVVTVFSSCKEVGIFFYQNFVFGQKKVEIFLRYKLVI